MPPFLVMGAGGFIGRAVVKALGPAGSGRSNAEWADPGLLDGVRAVLWAGRDPRLGGEAWRLEEDVELAMARRVAGESRAAFLTLSTRKVYRPSVEPLGVASPVGPVDRYGRQKLALEEALLGLLGGRLTRIRLANVFGWELMAGRRSFMALMLRSLVEEGLIRFDMADSTLRDFLPVDKAGDWLAWLLTCPPGGVVPMGSGVALPTGRLAGWLIEGFGRGRLVVENNRERDAFVMDAGPLRALIGEACSEAEIKAAAIALGRRLQGA